MRAIGISGYAGSGKTTLANMLQEDYGYERRHIATPLRAMLAELLRAFKLDELSIWAYLDGPLKEQVIPELGVTSRHAQISLGTAWGREQIGQNVWLDAWLSGIGKDDLVINDSVRFPNEAAAIHKLGGIVIRIDRPGVGPAKFSGKVGEFAYRTFGMMNGVHPSERIDLIKPDIVICNDRSVGDLRKDLAAVMAAKGRLPMVTFEARAA